MRTGTVRRILVAEDDREMRRVLVGALLRDGYDVSEVASGPELIDALALQLVSRVPPIDVIVSDLRMPGATGLQVLARLREAQWRTPFILITAFGGDDLAQEALDTGAFAVLEKPFDIDELRGVVVGALHAVDGKRPAVGSSW